MTTPSSTLLLFLFSVFISSLTLQSSGNLLLPLTHSLSASQFTSTHHLLKSTATRSIARHHQHQHKKSHRQVSLPLAPGSDYTLPFSLASSPSHTVSLYMDTGSDVVWLPCSPFECILCEGKYPPGSLNPLNVSKSSMVSCKSPSCSAAHSSLPSSDLCAMAKCPLVDIETSDCDKFSCPSFYYAYGDGSLVADLHKESLTMAGNTDNPLILHNFTFGCAHSTLGEPIGVAGFGRGSLSLPAQLADSSPELSSQFSYCLVSHAFNGDKLRQPSPLILGRYNLDGEQKPKGVDGNKDDVEKNKDDAEFAYTQMLDNPKHPYFYSVGLEAVSVGSRRIPAPENLRRVDRRGNGGIVVDSGTTFTMIPTKLFESIASELDRRVRRVFKRATDTEGRTGLGPCYYTNSRALSSGFVVPSLALHFGGNSTVVLPTRNYFYEFVDDESGRKGGKKVGCMMLMDNGEFNDGASGPGATLGNYQQQGFEVLYDLEKRRVGFAPRKCASLWDSLNSRR